MSTSQEIEAKIYLEKLGISTSDGKSIGTPSLTPTLQEYQDNGARLGWLINRRDRQVEIYRIGQPIEVLQAPTALSGETVLPDFVLDLVSIW